MPRRAPGAQGEWAPRLWAILLHMILAIDQGTSSTRAMVFNESFQVAAQAQLPLTQSFPRPGWVEHDPEEIIVAAVETARSAGASAAHELIGIANQRETTVVWEKDTGRAIHPAIVWQDRRTADRCEDLRRRGLGARIKEITGLEVDPYFSATKVEWILDHVEGARAKAEQGRLLFGTIDSWLIWRLTPDRVHATDPTNASRTLLWDLARGAWSQEMLELFRIPPAMLPQVLPSSGRFGASVLNGVLIAGAAGDQQAAAYGQACLAPGEVKCTYGTGCFALAITGGEPPIAPEGLLATAAAPGRLYALEGSVFVAGAAIQWLRDELSLIASAQESEALANSVPDSGGVAFVPAFAGLGAPHWDPSARGVLAGLARGTTKAHIVRAALEGVAHQVQDVLDQMGSVAELRVDGGMTDNGFLMQLQADLAGVPVIVPPMRESTALGAAHLALASRVPGHAPKPQAGSRVFEPRMSADERSSLRAVWAKAVQRSMGWA